MHKHKLAGIWHRIGGISMVILVIAFMATAAISIFALRANNMQMIKLKNAVYTADENNGDVESALVNLRNFVFSHMNTNLRANSNSSEPPIQLVNRFNAAVAAEQARIAALSASAASVYSTAQATCERASLALTARAQCIQDYVAQHGSDIPSPNLPPKEFYTFDFASPRWTPDLAGWSLVATTIIGFLIIIRIATGIAIRIYTK